MKKKISVVMGIEAQNVVRCEAHVKPRSHAGIMKKLSK